MDTSARNIAALVVAIVIVASVFVFSYQDPYFPQYFEIPFEVVDPGEATYQQNYSTRANFTITNTSHWESLWSLLYNGWSNPPEVPDINFTTYMLIAVFQGERGSSGYSTNITRIMMSSTEYVVFVDEVHPGNNCVTLAVMTYPYQIVQIHPYEEDLSIRFVYNIIIHDCG